MFTIDDSEFFKDFSNLIDYTNGFLVGAKSAEKIMLHNVSYKIKDALYSYIDSMARVDPQQLQHVYEWYQAGSPDARLFDIDCIVSDGGISFSYTFTQSKSVQRGSSVPFYNKAQIMEAGMPVTIRPRQAKALVFEENGETVFTKKEVEIDHPGGSAAYRGLEQSLKTFFNSYLSQTILDITGLRHDLNDFGLYRPGKTSTYSSGKADGTKWMSKVGTIE